MHLRRARAELIRDVARAHLAALARADGKVYWRCRLRGGPRDGGEADELGGAEPPAIVRCRVPITMGSVEEFAFVASMGSPMREAEYRLVRVVGDDCAVYEYAGSRCM